MIVTRRKYDALMKASDAAVEYYRDLYKETLSKAADLAMKSKAFEEQYLQEEDVNSRLSTEVAGLRTELKIAQSALKSAERALRRREGIQEQAARILSGTPAVVMGGKRDDADQAV